MGILSRTPPNFFAAPFGFTGLAGTWLALSRTANAPRGVSAALYVLAAVVWLVLLVGYLARVTTTRGRLMADLRDPVLSPFVSVIAISRCNSASDCIPTPPGPRRSSSTSHSSWSLGGWLTGQWMTGALDQDKFHPGYLCRPSRAGCLRQPPRPRSVSPASGGCASVSASCAGW